ncbi:hypothetical protein NMY22_g16048 [Coprinellus aureogranulatus]|nr:hypothetical protein NMY22_g16048 [Coprinellus aureogranulatus]
MAPIRRLPSTSSNDSGSEDPTQRTPPKVAFVNPRIPVFPPALPTGNDVSGNNPYPESRSPVTGTSRLSTLPLQPSLRRNSPSTPLPAPRAHTQAYPIPLVYPPALRRHDHPHTQIRVQCSPVPNLRWCSRDPLHVAAPFARPILFHSWTAVGKESKPSFLT